jgi:hypothetical protein
MKSIIATTVLISLSAPAFAGPYVNVESNSAFIGRNGQQTVIETHKGFDIPLGNSANFYLQGGPAFVLPKVGSDTAELSAKVGVDYDVTTNLNAYGEVYVISANTIDFDAPANVNVKAGVKYNF